MNSLVSCILLISSVINLSLGTDNSNKFGSQRTEVNAIITKPQEQLINNTILSQPANPLMPQLPEGIINDSILEVYLSATEWDWKIRKMGTFACHVLDATVSSPYDILVDFEGFANLLDPNSGTQINTWYAISQTAPPSPNSGDWITANSLNLSDFVIQNPINGATWNLWCKIEVTADITASEYSNNPMVTFVVQAIEHWVDPTLTSNERTGMINEAQAENH